MKMPSASEGLPASGHSAGFRSSLFALEFPHRLEQPLRRGIIPERPADVAEQVQIPRAEHKASAELERILAESLLTVTGAAGAGARDGIGLEKNVEQIRRPKPGCPVSLPLIVDEEGKPYAGFFTKGARVIPVAKTDGCQTRARGMKRRLVLAQLRDVLAAKDSAIVPEKNENRGAGLPERAQANQRAVGVRQRCVRECRSKSRRHIVHRTK